MIEHLSLGNPTLDFCVWGAILLLFVWGIYAIVTGLWVTLKHLGDLRFTETMPGSEGRAYRIARHQWIEAGKRENTPSVNADHYERG